MKLRINVENSTYEVQVDVMPEGATSVFDVETEAPASLCQPPPPIDFIPNDRICRSPIAGSIVSVAVAPGIRVRQNDTVVTIEAMKMQTAVGAPVGGIVEEVGVKPGDAVRSGQMLCRLA